MKVLLWVLSPSFPSCNPDSLVLEPLFLYVKEKCQSKIEIISISRPKEFTGIYNAIQLDRFLRVIYNENCKKKPNPNTDQNSCGYFGNSAFSDCGKSNVRPATTEACIRLTYTLNTYQYASRIYSNVQYGP